MRYAAQLQLLHLLPASHSMLKAPLALLLLATACQAPNSKGPRIPTPDQHSHGNPSQVQVTHVSLDLSLNFEAHLIEGTAELSFTRHDATAPLILDAQGLNILDVKGASGAGRTYSLDPEHDNLGSALRIELWSQDESVSIHYRTSPSSEALQWLAPEQTAGGKLPFLFSQGEPVLTRSWIPLQDSPGVRVTYDARIQAPAGMVSVMSAEESKEQADGSKLFHMSSPIPPYLIALACGDLRFGAISERCGVWADPNVLESAVQELEDTERMIQHAEELFGPYRWGRYDLLILPPAFPYGGMENPCLTFATPTILTGDKSLVSLVAHELAHSWSGNLVTNATWSDFWLNEGFTVYFESRIMESLYGPERAIMENALAYDGLIDEIAETPERDTILHIDLSGRHPDDGFSGIPYDKGALFLRRLEVLYGRARMDEFLRAWFDGHAFQSVSTADFIAFLQQELIGEEGAPELDLEAWIYGPGLPSSAPVVPSKAMAAVDAQLAQYTSKAKSAAQLETEGWVTQQWLHFLKSLPSDLSSEAMADLDSAFGFTASGNSEILCVWFQRTIETGYAQADWQLNAFLMNVGRAKFLRPIYKAMAKATPQKAKAIYANARSRYHSAATVHLDQIVNPR